MAEFSLIGKSVTRVDALEKVTGKAMYLATDFKLPGMLQGKVLWSPYPHARVLNIDTSKAEALPGVKAVVTAKDAPELKASGMCVMDNYFLARDVVRFVGDAVAAVAADTSEIAEEAVDLIKVDYEELPAVFDGEEALRKNPPAILHPNLSTYEKSAFVPVRLEPDMPNVNAHYQVRKGDVEKGFQEADVVVENRYSLAGAQHCPLEPHGAVAREESDGSLTVWTGGQGVYQVREKLSAALGMPPSTIRVLSSYTGGGIRVQSIHESRRNGCRAVGSQGRETGQNSLYQSGGICCRHLQEPIRYLHKGRGEKGRDINGERNKSDPQFRGI